MAGPKRSAPGVWEDLTEEECYLFAILDDHSGLDQAEFCHFDGSSDDGCFRAWPFQVHWWRCQDPYQIDLAARSVGKSLSIEKRMFAFPFRRPGQEAIITAPELVHLEPIAGLIEERFRSTRLGKELLPRGRSAITHRPFMINFVNGSRIIGRIPQRDGKGVKGLHPLQLEQDESQNYPKAGWIELNETLKRGFEGSEWRCVAEGQLVLTRAGWKPIEDIQPGDDVFTHMQRWRPVLAVHDNGTQDCVRIQGNGHHGLVVTPLHKFYTRSASIERRRSSPMCGRKKLGQPSWTKVEDFSATRPVTHWASPAAVRFDSTTVPKMVSPTTRSPLVVEDTSDLRWLWLYGLYIAEGYGVHFQHGGRNHRRVHWCVNDREADKVAGQLRALGFKPQFYRQGPHSVKVCVANAACYDWLTAQAGTLAHNKRLADWAFGLPRRQQEAIFDGMAYGDGCWTADRRRWEYATVSLELALSMKLFGQALGYISNLREKAPCDSVIDGRTIHSKRQYTVQMTHADDCYAPRTLFLDDGLAWSPVEDGWHAVGPRHVYDLEVAEDHSYVLEGMIVSNSHGVTMGLHNDFWEKTRETPDSMWTVHRLTAVHRPNWTDQERAEAIAKYGGRRDDPDFRRNVYGEHGEQVSALFVLSRLSKCWDDKVDSDYNTVEYKHLSVSLPMVEEARRDGTSIAELLEFPEHHRTYQRTWAGMDVGLTTDPSEILIFAEYEPDANERRQARERKKACPPAGVTRLKLLTRISLKRIANPDQIEFILRVIEFYQPEAFALDRTGIGLPLWMDLQAEYRKAEELAELVTDADDKRMFQERATFLRWAAGRIKGYNFSEKVIVALDDKVEVDERSEDPIKDAAMSRNVLEQSTEYVRAMVDNERLWLPWDRELLQEFEGQTFSFSSSPIDQFGKRRRIFKEGRFHAFDGCRMFAMAHGQQEIEAIVNAPQVQEDVLVITGDELFGY